MCAVMMKCVRHISMCCDVKTRQIIKKENSEILNTSLLCNQIQLKCHYLLEFIWL